ncbi:class I SAM-dependent methyltransferase [Aestuariivirga sp.]|uniref:class I SAM-dependent methyltransferase n=1 Tax=Aestuariivirga sp. TaxID=2650926 RepID=UPI0035AE4AFD
MRLDLAAASTWNSKSSIQEASDTIHDGATTPEELSNRAKGYVEGLIFGKFPEAIPSAGGDILEIGSGLGWIMQAMNDYLGRVERSPHSVTGLDIAPNMIEMARQRVRQDQVQGPLEFLLYDGIKVPLDSRSLDLIYSVATLQHVPRQFVFNLFFEIKRLLKPGAASVFQLMSTSYLPKQEKWHLWRTEITNQIMGLNTHWHHFYTAQELDDVLRITGFGDVQIFDDKEGTLVCCVRR